MYVCVCVYMYCVSFRMKHLGSQWTDFDNTWYFMNFPKSVQKFQVTLKSDNTSLEHPSASMITPRLIHLRKRNILVKIVREIKTKIYFQ